MIMAQRRWVCLTAFLMFNSSFWMQASRGTMVLLSPPGPEFLLPDQFPFSSFTQKRDLNFCFRFFSFPLDFVSRCVTQGHATHLLQNKGLSESCGTSFLLPKKISQALNCSGQPMLGIWNPSISLFGTWGCPERKE